MTSKNSCFDRAIFRRSLRRTAPVWGLFCLYELLLPRRVGVHGGLFRAGGADDFGKRGDRRVDRAVCLRRPARLGAVFLAVPDEQRVFLCSPAGQTADAVSDQLPDGAAAVRSAGAGVVAAVMGGRRRLRRVGLFARDAGVRGDGDGFFAVFLVCVAGVHGRRADGGCAARLRDAEFCRLRARVDRAASDADLCLRHARESDDRGRTRRGLRLAGLRPAARRLPRGDRMGRRGRGGL